MRLFIAIELPDELKRKLERLRMEIPGVRWVPAEQLHLTLVFLGEVDEATTAILTAQLAQIQTGAFELSPCGIGCFPDRRRPRVVWLGVKPEPKLLSLAQAVQQTVMAAGIILEERPFSPHLTLARLKPPAARELDVFLDRHVTTTLTPFPVQEFTLFQSRLTAQGAVHSQIKSFMLTAAGINRAR